MRTMFGCLPCFLKAEWYSRGIRASLTRRFTGWFGGSNFAQSREEVGKKSAVNIASMRLFSRGLKLAGAIRTNNPTTRQLTRAIADSLVHCAPDIVGVKRNNTDDARKPTPKAHATEKTSWEVTLAAREPKSTKAALTRLGFGRGNPRARNSHPMMT